MQGNDANGDPELQPVNSSSPPTPPQPMIVTSVTPPLGDVPNNVSTMEQLSKLPSDFLSGQKERPLKHIDDRGEELHYSLKPMAYSVFFILLVELLERFSFYGILYTQTSYLTGVYNDDWNADMTAVGASSYVSICIAIAYTSPFLGAILADTFLGEYWTIISGALGFYLPGLVLIAVTTIPHALGETFNKTALSVGLLFLWPVGTGMIKSVVNVFGAKQFHPLIQTALIESYYVNFYMCINVGALCGGIIVPILAQHNITAAYFIPVCMLCLAVLCFIAGTKKYVVAKPRGDLLSRENDGTGLSIIPVAILCLLIVPFNIAYSQMATTFIVQGTVMRKELGFIDAASMNNADAFSVLASGYIIGNHLYPWLAKKGYKIETTYKFAIGSFLGACAIAWALLVEYLIRSTYKATGETISVFWQAPSYFMIGTGEIFAVSSAYEVAFTAAPPQKKALASAINLFNVGGLPNVFCLVLYHACSKWFHNASGTSSIHTLAHYSEAHIYKYYLVLLGIALMGVAMNVHPFIKNWVKSVEEKAADAVRTPMATPILARRKLEREAGENLPLLRKMKDHQQYMKYGTGPILYKSGSMRAAPFLQKTDPKFLERQQKYVQNKLRRYEKPLAPRQDLNDGNDARAKEAPY